MKVVKAIFIFISIVALLPSCGREDYPVPAASTVSNFTYSVTNSSYAPATVTFNNASIVPVNAGDAYYSWTFGDGTKSTDINPVHIYSSAGSFTATLTVKTTLSQEIRQNSQSIVILNPGASGTEVYFTDGSKVYKGYLNADSPVFAALPIGPFNDCYGMAIDTLHSKLYISDSGDGKIYQYDTETQNLVEFRTGLSSPDGLAIDYANNMLYWDTDKGIQRSSLLVSTLSDAENFVSNQANDPEGVSIDENNKKVYWNCYDGGVWSINLDGSGITRLLASDGGGSTLVADSRLYFDYWVASGDIHLKSTALDGTGMSTLTTGISKLLYALAYEPVGKKIYWGDRSVGKIMRSNLNGSSIETWYTASGSSPRGIVFGKKK